MVVSVRVVSVCVLYIYNYVCVCMCTCVNDCLLVNVGSTVLCCLQSAPEFHFKTSTILCCVQCLCAVD